MHVVVLFLDRVYVESIGNWNGLFPSPIIRETDRFSSFYRTQRNDGFECQSYPILLLVLPHF